MHMLDRYIASTQRWLTVLYALLFSASLLLLVVLPKPIDDAIKTVLTSSTTMFGSILMMQNTFWFGRPRAAGVPDPGTSTETTTTTSQTTPATTESAK